MKLLRCSSLLVFILLADLAFNTAIAAVSSSPPPATVRQAWEIIQSDYRHFYLSRDYRLHLAGAFTVGGIMANSNMDQYIRDWYQDHVRGSKSDDFSRLVKPFGQWKIMLPVSLATFGVDYLMPNTLNSPIGFWGKQTLRAYITAAPLMYASQWLTGASRPGERNHASHWRPLEDVNGVSGHAFVGAVPFMTIARMNSSPLIHYGAYAASALTAWSRVNDDAHFTSQALLGWYIAYETTESVFGVDKDSVISHLSITPLEHGADLQIEYFW